jgi:hypothetical protein
MYIQVDHVEPKMEIQAKQVCGVFGGPQASSGRDTNLDWIKASPSASNHRPWTLFLFMFTYGSWMCIRS